LEHRKGDLRNVATYRLLTNEDMRAFLSLVRDWWKKRRAAGEQLIDIADRLDIWFDPANYETREDPEHGLLLVNVALERAQAEQATEHQDMNDLMLVTGFPIRCRTILDERRGQTDVQLDELWQIWIRIRKLAEAGPALPGGERRFGDEYVNAIAAGIAVFLWHDVWLSQDASRRVEVEGALESLIAGDLPERNGFHSEHDVSSWSWDCFVAEAAAMSWAREPQDVRWRRVVAEMVFAEKYATVRLLFSRCAEHRAALGQDFERLRRLAVDWAHVRDRVNVLRASRRMVPQGDDDVQGRLESELTAWMEEKLTAFVDGTSALLSSDWSRFDEAPRFAEVDALRRRSSDASHLDFHLVRCSHEWLPLPDAALRPDERARVIHFWQVALDIVAARPRADLQRRDHQYPHEDEVWVLQNVAAMVLQLQPAENPRPFWQAVIDLHSEAHDWPEKFLNALHRRALSSESTPATYEPVLREVVQRAFSDVDGQRRWPRHEEVWDALIGIDYWVSDVWADRHADHVLRIWDAISLWMEKAPQDGRRLGKFAGWLSKPAAASIRLRVLPWFLEQFVVGKKRDRDRDNDAPDNVARLLNVVWDRDQVALRASSQAFAAFRGLLAWLVERQNSLGLELQGRIGGLS